MRKPKGAGADIHQIGPRGELRVPLHVLEEVGLGPKMRVRFKVKGKTLFIEKALDAENPLDGSLGKKPDKDLFGKVLAEQEKDRERAREMFDKGLEEAAENPDEPPDHPFRWD
jgi:hypothetical protein